MKIMIVCPKKYVCCGVFDYSLRLSESLLDRNEVIFVTNKFHKKDIDKKTCSLINNILPNWEFQGFYKLVKCVINTKPDFVNFQYAPSLYTKRGGFDIYLIFVFILLKILHIKTVLTIHEHYSTNFLKRIALKPIQFILVLFSYKIFTSTEEFREEFRKLIPFKKDDIFWIPVTSNISYYKISKVKKDAIRKKLNLNSKNIIISIFNPYGTVKGPGKVLNEVLYTWDIIRERRNDLKLLFIGGINHSGYKLIDKNIIAFPNITEKEVGELFAISDIYFSPFRDGISSRRGSSIAAMNYSLPIVTTKGIATDSIFFNSPLFLSSTKNARYKLAKDILLLAESKTLRENIGNKTKEFYDKYFAIGKVKEKFFNNLN